LGAAHHSAILAFQGQNGPILEGGVSLFGETTNSARTCGLVGSLFDSFRGPNHFPMARGNSGHPKKMRFHLGLVWAKTAISGVVGFHFLAKRRIPCVLVDGYAVCSTVFAARITFQWRGGIPSTRKKSRFILASCGPQWPIMGFGGAYSSLG
jgi:hypothetical protein